jgi:hypothetical protein
VSTDYLVKLNPTKEATEFWFALLIAVSALDEAAEAGGATAERAAIDSLRRMLRAAPRRLMEVREEVVA